MLPQQENNLLSSFALWLDHTLLQKGQAYTNVSSYFYNTNQVFTNYKVYAAPFKQFVYDTSVSGATVITGLYLSGNFITPGQGGFSGINYQDGYAYFSSNIITTGSISGTYAIKDFNIKMTSQSDEIILFETKYQIRPKFNQGYSGLSPEIETYPVIYIKNDGGQNNPFAFGGIADTRTRVRCFVISDSEFKLDAVKSILKDQKDGYIGLLTTGEMPFNSFGGLYNGNYNYISKVASKQGSNLIFIDRVDVSKININTLALTDLKKIGTHIFAGIIDFELSVVREPRIS